MHLSERSMGGSGSADAKRKKCEYRVTLVHLVPFWPLRAGAGTPISGRKALSTLVAGQSTLECLLRSKQEVCSGSDAVPRAFQVADVPSDLSRNRGPRSQFGQ
jgi:hypothetical protein